MKYLSTGAFAKLCGVKKDTILFYDREGLLKPKYISGNGYRKYGVEQFYDFDMIAMLKETGSSLKEIKEHIRKKNPSRFLDILKEKQALLRKERKRLAQRQAMLESVIRLTQEALDTAYDTLQFFHQAEEVLEIFPIDLGREGGASKEVNILIDYNAYFEEQNRIPTLPSGFIVSEETASAGFFVLQYFFCKAVRSTPKIFFHTKPKGEYAVWAHQGTEQSHVNAFTRMVGSIHTSGKKTFGHAYAYDMMSYILLGGANAEYALRYCVQVR